MARNETVFYRDLRPSFNVAVALIAIEPDMFSGCVIGSPKLYKDFDRIEDKFKRDLIREKETIFDFRFRYLREFEISEEPY